MFHFRRGSSKGSTLGVVQGSTTKPGPTTSTGNRLKDSRVFRRRVRSRSPAPSQKTTKGKGVENQNFFTLDVISTILLRCLWTCGVDLGCQQSRSRVNVRGKDTPVVSMLFQSYRPLILFFFFFLCLRVGALPPRFPLQR